MKKQKYFSFEIDDYISKYHKQNTRKGKIKTNSWLVLVEMDFVEAKAELKSGSFNSKKEDKLKFRL